jgi:hypothetical protein
MHWSKWALASLPLLAIGAPAHGQSYAESESFATIFTKINLGCILKTWRIKGVSVCIKGGEPTPCVIVENAYPVGILETVKAPFPSHIKEAAVVARGLEKAGGELGAAPNGGSSHTSDSSPGSGLHFSEARAFMFVPNLDAGGLPIAVPPITGYGVAYLSEIDPFSFRSPLLDSILKAPRIAAGFPSCDTQWRVALNDCAGNWGSFYPRLGFANSPSSVIAAYLVALRAGRIASDPIAHIVVGSYPYEPRTGHYLQPVRPSLGACGKIGDPLILKVERAAGSSKGQEHLLIHFGIFEGCKPCWGARLVGARAP